MVLVISGTCIPDFRNMHPKARAPVRANWPRFGIGAYATPLKNYSVKFTLARQPLKCRPMDIGDRNNEICLSTRTRVLSRLSARLRRRGHAGSAGFEGRL